MKLWIVGKNTAEDTWEFVGVFSSAALAERACLTADFFVGSATLDEESQDISQEWDGAYIPQGAA